RGTCLVTWNGFEKVEIDTVGDDKGVFGQRGFFHLLRFDGHGLAMAAEPLAETHNEQAFLTVGSVGRDRSQEVIPKEGRHDGCCPLQAPDEAPEAVVPMHDVETSCQRLEKRLQGGGGITQWHRQAWFGMNNLHLMS